MAGSEYRDASREQWSGAADRWADAAEKPDKGASARAAAWMLDAVALQPGERVLEIACGAGRVGLEAAEIVGEDGTVVCSDFSEAMVDVVRARIDRHGVTNIETRILDAEEMQFPDGERFDAALCRMGFMLMSDPAKALARTRAALRPGGRLALAVWAPAEDNPWLAAIFDAVMAHLGAPPPAPGTPGPFTLGDPDLLRSMLEEAGFGDPRVERLVEHQTYDSPDGWWDEILGLGGPLAALLGALPADGLQAVREAAFEGARPYAGPGGEVTFPATVIAAFARPDEGAARDEPAPTP